MLDEVETHVKVVLKLEKALIVVRDDELSLLRQELLMLVSHVVLHHAAFMLDGLK